jgi:hypothetical protein
MAFSGQQLTLSGAPTELIPVVSPTGGEPTAVATIVNGGTIMSATSSGVALTQIGPATAVNTPVTFAMSPYTVVAADIVLMCATSGGAISVVLPTAASSTNRVIQVVDASGSAASNNVTITVSGGGTINGSASYVINLAYGTATFFSTGAFWVVTDKIASSGGGGGYATGVRQIVNSYTGGVSSTSTTLPADNTIPQNTEGAQFLTATITPQSATSTLVILASIGAFTTGGGIAATVTAALFRDATANAFAAATQVVNTSGTTAHMFLSYSIASAAAVATTIRLRMGQNTAGTMVFNGYAGPTQYFGGVTASGLTVIEVGA